MLYHQVKAQSSTSPKSRWEKKSDQRQVILKTVSIFHFHNTTPNLQVFGDAAKHNIPTIQRQGLRQVPAKKSTRLIIETSLLLISISIIFIILPAVTKYTNKLYKRILQREKEQIF